MIYMEHCHLPMQVIFQNEELSAEVEAIVKRDTGHGIERYKEAPTSFHQMVCLDEDSDISERGKRQIYTLLSRWDKLVPFPLGEMYPFLKQEEWVLPMRDVSHMKVYIQMVRTENTETEKVEKADNAEAESESVGKERTEKERTEVIQWEFAVESIEKRKRPNSERIMLYCYPHEGELCPEFVIESALSTMALNDDKKADPIFCRIESVQSHEPTSNGEPRSCCDNEKQCFLYIAENEHTVHEIVKSIFLMGTWVIEKIR